MGSHRPDQPVLEVFLPFVRINQTWGGISQAEGDGVDREVAVHQILGQGLALKESKVHEGAFPLSMADHSSGTTPRVQGHEVAAQVVGQGTGQ